MKTITLDWLEKRHACPEASMTFLKRFGKRASVKDVVDTLHKLHRDDWEAWLLSQDYRLTFSMLECGADVHVNHDGAIRLAVQYGRLKIVQLLLEHGADVRACKYDPICLTSQFGNFKLIQFLLEYDADAGIYDDKDYVFILAAKYGHLKVVQLFIERGGVNVHDNADLALRLAVSNGHPRVAHLLRKKSQTV